MKKLFVIISIIVVFLVAAIFVTPVLFKDKISGLVLETVNESVNAEIYYESFHLSLFQSLPDFTASFNGITIVGANSFKQDTLAAFKTIAARIDLMSVFKMDGIIIENIKVDDGQLNLIVNEKGEANWDVSKFEEVNETTTETLAVEDETTALKFLFDNVELNNFDFSFASIEGDYRFYFHDLDGTVTGEMEGMTTLLQVKANIPSINFDYNKVSYLKEKQLNIETEILADLDRFVFSFNKGQTQMNNMPLAVDGQFSMPGDSMFFDLAFSVPEITMQDLLDLIPDDYQKYMKDVQTSGNVSFDGEIGGLYYDDVYPSIDIDLILNDGLVKYPDLPDELKIETLNASISKKEGDLDLLVLGINDFKMSLADNPFEMKAVFGSLMSDMNIGVSMKGNVDVGSLTKVVPLGDTKMTGLLKTDLVLKGNYSAIEANDFSEFLSVGKVSLSNFSFKNSSVPQGVNISNAALVLYKQDINIKGLKGNIGKSDFQVSGQISEFLNYAFAGEELIGQFILNSKLINANEFLQEGPATDQGGEVYAEIDSSKVVDEPFVLPENMHFKFLATIDHLLFDHMDISNFTGDIELKNQKLNLKNLSMNMVDGQLKANGFIIADGRANPVVNFDLNVLGFDLPAAHRDLSIVRKYMPFAAKSQGEFSTQLKLKSKLSTDLKMVMSTISAGGYFSTNNVKLVNTNFFESLKSVVKHEKLRNIEVDNFMANYTISNGNLKIKPFSTKLANQPIRLDGTYNLGGTIDFNVDATVDKQLLSNDIQSMIAYIPGHQRVQNVDVGIRLKGDAKKPDVEVNTDKLKQQVVDQLKNSSKEELEDAAKKLLQGLFR